jgi:hypothetical protein
MAEHSFGGPWTERKLKCLRDYLSAYRTIFTGNPKARYFSTWYIDAFAGTGSRTTAADTNPSSVSVPAPVFIWIDPGCGKAIAGVVVRCSPPRSSSTTFAAAELSQIQCTARWPRSGTLQAGLATRFLRSTSTALSRARCTETVPE